VTRYLLAIIGATSITFAPNVFPDEASCRLTAAALGERSVDAVRLGAGLKIACLPVAEVPVAAP
jgi:hypothetical protein